MSEPRSIPFGLAVLPFAVSITGLFSAIFWLDAPLYLGLLLGWATAMAVALCYGRKFRQLLRGTYTGAKSTFFVIGILLMIAGVISAWLASGTVPGMIWYGIQLVRPEYLVVSAFLLTAAGSMALGSSVGTLSTMGAALAGIAAAFNFSPALIGGALISGALVGDRTSPVSGTFHLVASMTGTKAEDNHRPMWQTGGVMVLVCAVLFCWLGYGKASGTADPMSSPLVRALVGYFQLPWYVVLPPALTLLLALFRVKILQNLAIGIVFGVVLAYTVQGLPFTEILQALWVGYDLTIGGARVLHGGGIWPMFHQVLLILTAGALNGVLEESGMMGVMIGQLLQRIERASGLVMSTVLLSILMAMLACNQALSVIVPARTLRDTYDRMGVPSRYLVRTLADSGVVVSPLIPWNLHGILCSTAMGIATTVYFPYAFYLWGLPILTILLSFALNRRHNSNKLDKLLPN
jgi:Na+:H+ antiporter, NhaC family